MGLFGKGKEKGKEKAEIRSQLRSKLKPKKDPVETVKDRLARFTAKTHRDYAPPVYGLKLWWILGYDKKGKEHYDGPFYTAWDADRKLATYDDGEIFELRNIDTKAKAEEEIKRILKERQEEEQAFLQERLTPPSSEPPTRKFAEPERRFRFPFSKDGRYEERGNANHK